MKTLLLILSAILFSLPANAARDGSGTYTNPYSFTSGTTISSSQMNSNFSEIATALTGSIPRDGQAAPTANIPWGGFAITGAGNITGTAFIPSGSSAPTNGLYLPAANTPGIAVNSAGEVQLTATALSPVASDGNALGTASLMWGDLFLASGGVINFNAGNVTLTHSAGALSLTGSAGVALTVSSAVDVLTVPRYSADATGQRIVCSKSRNATVGSHTIVQAADELCIVIVQGSDGTNFDQAGYFGLVSGGTPGAGTDMPGAFVVGTSPDGSATPIERFRITPNGHVEFTGTEPSVGTGASDCGTGPAIGGTDTAGTVTVGTTPGSLCTLTFASAFTNAPICLAQNLTADGRRARVTSTSTTTVVITAIATLNAGDLLSYICIGDR